MSFHRLTSCVNSTAYSGTDKITRQRFLNVLKQRPRSRRISDVCLALRQMQVNNETLWAAGDDWNHEPPNKPMNNFVGDVSVMSLNCSLMILFVHSYKWCANVPCTITPKKQNRIFCIKKFNALLFFISTHISEIQLYKLSWHKIGINLMKLNTKTF